MHQIPCHRITESRNDQTIAGKIEETELENLTFDILDKSMPSVINSEKPNDKVTFTVPGEELDKSDLGKNNVLLWELEKSNPPQKSDRFLYEDPTQSDDLVGYGLGNDGNLYNEHGHLIIDGYNQTKKCKEDLIRKRSKLPVIGDQERWKKARTEKVERMKRKLDNQMGKDPTMETISKKARLEIADSLYNERKYKEAENSKRLKIRMLRLMMTLIINRR